MAELPGVQLACACGVGILAARAAPWSAGGWASLALLGGVAAIGLSRRGTGSRFVAALPLVAAAMAMAAWSQASLSAASFGAASFGAASGGSLAAMAEDDWQPVVLRAVVASSPERRPNALATLYGRGSAPRYQSVVELEVQCVRGAERWEPASGRVRATVEGDISERLVGDCVTVYGHWQRIDGPTNPGAVDMRAIYAPRGIAVQLRVDSPSQFVLESPEAWGLRRALSWIGVAGERALYAGVGEEAGPLAAALVLGRRQAVDPETRDRLVETGTAHLLSVSGLHLGMVAGVVAMALVLLGWPRGWQVTAVVAVCVFYAALTGARPPVLRASMLVGAVLVGSWAGKQTSSLNSLGLAAVALLVLDPQNLLQTGTQLSFVAVVVLVLAGRRVMESIREDDPLETLLQSTRPWIVRAGVRQWRRAVRFTLVSFWVWAATAPLVWQAFGIVAPVSVLANLLMIAPLTVALVGGLFTAAVGMFGGPLAIPFGWICLAALETMRGVVELCGEIPLGHFWLPPPPFWWVVAFYAVAVAGALVPAGDPSRGNELWGNKLWGRGLRGERRGKWMLAWMVLWTLVAWPLATHREHDPETLAVTFIDVGHGTSALVELPDGGVWLYDAGRLGDPLWSAQPIEDVLWSRGIWRLDGIIVSHADADHYNAIPGLLERFQVAEIVTPPGMLEQRQSGLDPVRQAIRRERVPVRELHSGMEFRTAAGHPWGRCLHPPMLPVAGSDNANSLVLRIDHRGRTILLPGDLEMPGSEHLLRHSRPPPGGMLMAPHHGSVQEDARTLLDWMRPSVVVVSGGNRSLREEVRQMLGQGGAEVRLTAAEGAVRVEVDRAGELTVRGWKADGF